VTVKLTLHHDVLALPEVFWGVESTRIDGRGVFPGDPLSPVTTEIPRVAYAVRTVGLMSKRVLSI